MKLFKKARAFGLILVVATSQYAMSRPLKVILDPGHGGIDSGTVGFGFREADLVLEISKKLKKLLENDPDTLVLLTRSTNQRLALSDRVKFAEESSADLFLSLHVNSSEDLRAKGMEVYIQNNLPADEESLLIASLENQREEWIQTSETQGQSNSLSKKGDVRNIVEELRRTGRIKASHRLGRSLTQSWNDNLPNKKMRQAPFYVISRISVPSSLVELGYLTHPQDRELLTKDASQNEIAQRIFAGVEDYLRQVRKSQ